MYCVLFATHTRWQNDISIHGRYWNRSSGDSYNLCFESWIFKHVISLLRFMLMFWIFVSPFKCALYDNSLNGVAFLSDILFWSWLQSQSSSNYLPFRKTLQIWGKQSRFRISFLSCWALRRVSSQVGQMGTLSKVKRMSLALPQVLPSLDSFGVAICTHVATALVGGTKCWFELQSSSPAFFWFASNSINSGEEVLFSPFQIRAAYSKNSRRLGAKAFRWVKAKKSLHSRKGDQIFRSSP